MVMRDLKGGILTPKHLGVSLPDFTEWALPCVLLEGEQDIADLGRLEKVAHTWDLELWEDRIVQHLAYEPLQQHQKYQKYQHKDRAPLYRTNDLGWWHEAYQLLDSVHFLKGRLLFASFT